MTSERILLSQSSLQDYSDCPRRFELRHLQRLTYPAVEAEPALENERHQREGELFHRLAQQFLSGVDAERVGRQASSPNLVRWWDQFLDFTQRELTGLIRRWPETTLSTPLGPYRLIAKYDLAGSTQDGRILIYDWKTLRRRPRNESLQARWQTRIYRALAVLAGAPWNGGRAVRPEQVEMIYWFTDFPAEPARFRYEAGQFQRDWDALARLAGEISAATVFPLTEDRQKCGLCPYRSYCNRGGKAADARDAQLESEEEESFDIRFEQIGEIQF